MSLTVSKVPRALEIKAKLFGFELGDLLIVFLYLGLSNLIFGQTRLKFPLVWMGTLAIAGTLYFVKRDKPENYLQHAGEHMFSPGVLAAGAPDVEYRPYPPFKNELKTEEGLHDES
jgi:hypothetical protein